MGAKPFVISELYKSDLTRLIDSAGVYSGAVSTTSPISCGDLTMGTSGGGDKSFKVYSSTPGRWAEISLSGGHVQFASRGGGYASLWADGNAVWLGSAPNKDMYFDAGNVFYFRDCDASNAQRMTLNSANGNLWTGGNIASDGDNQIGAGKAYYLGSSTTDGSWRIIPNGANLEIQKRVSGAWVAKQTITG